MGSGKINLAFITQRSKRKAAFNKRKKGLMKKMEELTTLCAIEACAIIHCREFEPEPIYWPSRPEVERMVGKFRSLTHDEQTKNMSNPVSLIEKKIRKIDEGLKRQMWENRQTELTMTMFDCLAGRSNLGKCKVEDMGHLAEMVDLKLREIEKRIESLKVNDVGQGAGPSSSNAAGPSTSNAAGPSTSNVAGPSSSNAAGPRSSYAIHPISSYAGGPISSYAGGPSSSNAAGPSTSNAAGPSTSNVAGPSSSNAAGPSSSNAADYLVGGSGTQEYY